MTYIQQKWIVAFTILAFCLIPGIGHPQTSPVAGPSDVPPEHKGPLVQQIGPGEYRIGDLTLNKAKREITIPGQVNMQTGLVEYLACWDKEGKLHESVLKVRAKPSDIQVGLILLGLQKKNNLQFQGDPAIPEGDKVEVWVEWRLPDKTRKKVRGEELILDQKTTLPMGETDWAFSGSLFNEGIFMADREGSIIAIFRDPVAIINNILPEGSDDTRYFSNEKILPPVGTDVTLTIKGVSP